MPPVFRSLPAGSGTYGHPVLSIWQTDIIYYGNFGPHVALYIGGGQIIHARHPGPGGQVQQHGGLEALVCGVEDEGAVRLHVHFSNVPALHGPQSILTRRMVIAIDGPSASGKGTVARRAAAALGFHFLDSGALYRLVALAADDPRRRAALLQDDALVMHPGPLNRGVEIAAEVARAIGTDDMARGGKHGAGIEEDRHGR